MSLVWVAETQWHSICNGSWTICNGFWACCRCLSSLLIMSVESGLFSPCRKLRNQVYQRLKEFWVARVEMQAEYDRTLLNRRDGQGAQFLCCLP